MIKLENPYYKRHDGLIIDTMIKSHNYEVPYLNLKTGHIHSYVYVYSGHNDLDGYQIWVLESPRDRGQI